jgi:hypothetical protein
VVEVVVVEEDCGAVEEEAEAGVADFCSKEDILYLKLKFKSLNTFFDIIYNKRNI